jgi:hypothetical protein
LGRRPGLTDPVRVRCAVSSALAGHRPVCCLADRDGRASDHDSLAVRVQRDQRQRVAAHEPRSPKVVVALSRSCSVDEYRSSLASVAANEPPENSVHGGPGPWYRSDPHSFPGGSRCAILSGGLRLLADRRVGASGHAHETEGNQL